LCFILNDLLHGQNKLLLNLLKKDFYISKCHLKAYFSISDALLMPLLATCSVNAGAVRTHSGMRHSMSTRHADPEHGADSQSVLIDAGDDAGPVRLPRVGGAGRHRPHVLRPGKGTQSAQAAACTTPKSTLLCKCSAGHCSHGIAGPGVASSIHIRVWACRRCPVSYPAGPLLAPYYTVCLLSLAEQFPWSIFASFSLSI